MASVSITRTTALFPSAVFVQWDVVPEETGTHLIEVFRAGGPEGPWEPIFGPVPSAYHYLDQAFNLPAPPRLTDDRTGLNFFSLARQVYYYVKVTPPSGSINAFSSPPVEIDPGLDKRTRLFKRKILRDEATAFRRLNGVPLIVLKRRHWGTRCRVCYDPVTREATLEHCTECFGTAFEGGYWAPVLIRGRKSAAPVQAQVMAHGDSETKYVHVTLLDYPNIEYKDLIIDLRRNDRYIVQIATPTELKGVTVHQVAASSLLARSSVEYTIPVDPATTPPLY